MICMGPRQSIKRILGSSLPSQVNPGSVGLNQDRYETMKIQSLANHSRATTHPFPFSIEMYRRDTLPDVLDFVHMLGLLTRTIDDGMIASARNLHHRHRVSVYALATVFGTAHQNP